MAHVVKRSGGNWELRESHATTSGPRSRTLATFRTLTPSVLAHAATRSSGPLDPLRLRRAARRAGAPVSGTDADRAAGELIDELAAGRGPRPALRDLLLDALELGRTEISDSARAAGRWASATPQRRGEALWDLLLVVDRLPPMRRHQPPRFPCLRSKSA